MVAALKARPTEYKGTCYRSKSEAMFARWLELRIEAELKPGRFNRGGNVRCGGFIYEPEFLRIDNWTPDFYSWHVYGSRHSEPWVIGSSIEYKPSKPTCAYVREFGERSSAVIERAPIGCAFELYWGGFYEGESGLIIWSPDCGAFEVPDENNWSTNFRDEVLATRFDLEAA